jgi:hypothetical protein
LDHRKPLEVPPCNPFEGIQFLPNSQRALPIPESRHRNRERRGELARVKAREKVPEPELEREVEEDQEEEVLLPLERGLLKEEGQIALLWDSEEQ